MSRGLRTPCEELWSSLLLLVVSQSKHMEREIDQPLFGLAPSKDEASFLAVFILYTQKKVLSIFTYKEGLRRVSKPNGNWCNMAT